MVNHSECPILLGGELTESTGNEKLENLRWRRVSRGEFASSQFLGTRPPRLLAMCYAGVCYLEQITCARGQEKIFAT